MSFVSGVHMSFIAGDRSITSAEQLDVLLMGIADGVAAAYSRSQRKATALERILTRCAGAGLRSGGAAAAPLAPRA